MNALQIAAEVSLRKITGDIWGVTGPYQGQVVPSVAGRHVRVWLYNGYGVTLLDNEDGTVSALLIRHVPGAIEAIWTTMFAGSNGEWEHNVTADDVESLLSKLRDYDGTMAPIDHARG